MRSSYEPFTDLHDLLARAAQLSVKTMIFDVEPLVAFWDSSQEALDRGVAFAHRLGYMFLYYCPPLTGVPVAAAARALLYHRDTPGRLLKCIGSIHGVE